MSLSIERIGRKAACEVRLFCLFLVLAAAMTAADLKIDHVTVAGTKLATLRTAFEAATALPTEYGGPHSNHATEMALTSFPDGSYLEFIAIQPNPDPAAIQSHPWSKYMSGNAGPAAFAVRVADINAEVSNLKAAGLHVHSPEKSGRTRPDGVRLDWETVDLGVGPRGSFFPFLIRDATPRERRVYTTGKPTTDRFSGISKVVIGVRELDIAISQYRRAFDLSEPKMDTDPRMQVRLAWFEGSPIVLAQGTSETSWVSLRVRHFGDGLCAVVLRSSGGLIGNVGSKWFGRHIIWAHEGQLGWHLGFETAQ
jgi:hypothetical protein